MHRIPISVLRSAYSTCRNIYLEWEQLRNGAADVVACPECHWDPSVRETGAGSASRRG